MARREKSPPHILTGGAFKLHQLRETRELIGTMIADEPAAAAVDPNAPVALDRLLIPLPANVSDEIKQRAMGLANGVRRRGPNRSDLPAVSSQAPGTGYTRAR